MVHPTTIRTTAQARTGLRVIEPGVLARAGVHPHNLIVLHMELQAAAARAVDGAMAPRDLLLGLRERRLGCAEQVRTRCSGAADGGQSTQRTRRFDERAAVHAWHVLHCLPLHSFLCASVETDALSRAATRHLPCTALTPCATPASLVRARLPLQAHLVMRPYRLAWPTVSHKTCEFRVCPGHRLSPIAVCDSLNAIARYTVYRSRFRIPAAASTKSRKGRAL